MRVRFTRPAQADLDQIYSHIAKDSPFAAARVVRRLIDRAMALADTPYAGREADEPNVRVVVIPRYRYFIFYLIDGDEVRIVYIRHTSRKRQPWLRED